MNWLRPAQKSETPENPKIALFSVQIASQPLKSDEKGAFYENEQSPSRCVKKFSRAN